MTTFYLVLLFELNTVILGLISISFAIGAALYLIGRSRNAS